MLETGGYKFSKFQFCVNYYKGQVNMNTQHD